MRVCDLCHEKPATIHVQESVHGRERTLHVCPTCAAREKLTPKALDSLSLTEFLYSFADLAAELGEDSERDAELDALECPTCGLTGAQFREHGLLGCPSCYAALAPCFGADRPTGGLPLPGPLAPPERDAEARRGLRDLQDELDRAVEAENYERAAILRDEIQELQQSATSENEVD